MSLANNEILRPKQTKLTDFGLAKDIKSTSVYTSLAMEESNLPVAWTAPEGFSGRFSSRSDLFAFGVLLFEVFSWASMPYGICSAEHQCPLTILSHEEIEFALCVKKRTLLNHPAPCTSTFSDALKALMKLCFLEDAFSRPTFKKFQTFLNGAKSEIINVEVPDIVRFPPSFEDLESSFDDMKAGIVYPKQEVRYLSPRSPAYSGEENGRWEASKKANRPKMEPVYITQNGEGSTVPVISVTQL